jgi:demethylmenaquinone methyltransferase/2-methoxy-6-polyprenyl-1,4-benzoquinol methylase
MSKYMEKDGKYLGLDISPEMIAQFNKKCAKFPNIQVADKRIDIDLPHENEFDMVFISFVLHGFPQEARLRIIQNTIRALKPGGTFFILDYSEIPLKDMPFFVRGPFRAIECPYAFDYMERDWKKILADRGFGNFTEVFFYRGYLRLLGGVKL